MKTILKIKFDNTFYLFLLLILVTGMFKEFTFIFILIFFHEIGHALTGIILNWKLVNITFYPYGGVTLFDKRENSSINKEIIILLMGPIFQIITYFILSKFYTYSYIKTYHLTILIFNLLPILTLDGGKLLNLFLNKVFNYLTSFYISIVISIISIILLIIVCFFFYNNFNLFLMSIFLFFKIIKSIKDIKYCYHRFLLERYLYDYKFNKRKISKSIYRFYKECCHYIEFNDEKEYLNKYFKNNDKNRGKVN